MESSFWALLLALLLGALLASNIPPLGKLLSLEEFFYGILKGMTLGENWRNRRKGKK